MRYLVGVCGLSLFLASFSQAAERPQGGMSLEERIVRHAYMKLMRYQAAAANDRAAESGTSPKADDYVTFGIVGLRQGRIADLAKKDLAELATPRQGNVLVVTRVSRGEAEGLVPHASYDVAWTEVSEPPTQRISLRRWLDSRSKRGQRPTSYSAYFVAVSLRGVQRVYRALALHSPTAALTSSLSPTSPPVARSRASANAGFGRRYT